MRFLVINLTRLGDIIQSLAFIRGLKAKDPNCIIDFLAMSSFAKILENVSDINEIILLDDKCLIDDLSENFWSGFKEIKQKVDYLNKKHYHEIINPVISLQSSYLTYLIKAKKKSGMTFTENREQSIKSDWSSFLLSNQHNLGDHSFNLVDIFSGVANVKNKIEYNYLKASDNANNETNALFAKEISSTKKLLGFHIGASQSNKSWDVEAFKNVIEYLLKEKQFEIILFGGYKELEVKTYFDEFISPSFHNWIGRFNLDQLISSIAKLDLFITNDTGPMHIAASVKVPIINISLGPVSMWETGPYSDQALVLQAKIDCHPCAFTYVCPHWNCHKIISPETLIKSIHYVFTHDSNLLNDKNVLYWKSAIDPFDCIHWVPINKRQISEKELIFEFKRAIWGLSLFRLNNTEKVSLRSYFDFLKLFFEIPVYDFKNHLAKINELVLLTEHISVQLKDISKISLSSKINLDKIKFIWSNVKDLKEQLFVIAKEYSVIYDWFLHLSFLESQLESNDIKILTLETSDLYKNLIYQLNSMQQCLTYSF